MGTYVHQEAAPGLGKLAAVVVLAAEGGQLPADKAGGGCSGRGLGQGACCKCDSVHPCKLYCVLQLCSRANTQPFPARSPVRIVVNRVGVRGDHNNKAAARTQPEVQRLFNLAK